LLAASAAAWTQSQLKQQDLDFLASLPVKTVIDGSA
jgi:hypothetical protein